MGGVFPNSKNAASPGKRQPAAQIARKLSYYTLPKQRRAISERAPSPPPTPFLLALGRRRITRRSSGGRATTANRATASSSSCSCSCSCSCSSLALLLPFGERRVEQPLARAAERAARVVVRGEEHLGLGADLEQPRAVAVRHRAHQVVDAERRAGARVALEDLRRAPRGPMMARPL